MNDLVIECVARTVYGKTLYYPTNDRANYLAHIAGTETLTMQTLKLAKDMGLRVKISAELPDEAALL